MDVCEVNINWFYGFGEFVESELCIRIQVKAPEYGIDLVLRGILGLAITF